MAMMTLTPTPNPEQVALRETEEYRQMLQSMQLLGDAIHSLHQPVSPMMAAGVAATENAWHQMEAEFGLLEGRQVAELAGSKQRTGGYANDLRKRRRVLGVKQRNAYLYPGFQFGETGEVRPAVREVLKAADELQVSDDGVAQWFCIPSTSLGDKRPVDIIDDVELIAKVFRNRFGVEW
jgi:hypothetical protein